MKKIKPGYYILLILALFFAYKYFFDDSKEISKYTNNINAFLTDIKHEDSFALHNKLSDNLKHTLSIDDIKEFIDNNKLGIHYKFILKNYKKTQNTVDIKGVVIANSKELPLDIVIKDTNQTFVILKGKLGSSEIKAKKLAFPLAVTVKQ